MTYNFWDFKDSQEQAVVTGEYSYTYQELNDDIHFQQQNFLLSEKQLILLLCRNNYYVLVTYIAALRSGHAVMMLNADINSELLLGIINKYQPTWIYGSMKHNEYIQVKECLWERINPVKSSIHPELAILMSTSGTTGSQKFVRLSYNNIQSNAEAIREYLQLTSSERALVNLPFSYSYGLSIINSHLKVGATIVLTEEGIMEKTFWNFLREKKVTSFAGVPFTYQVLQRIGFLNMDLPDLKMFTQAGGRLNEKLAYTFGKYAKEHNKKFFIMYGQTEASPRMSYIPPDNLLDKVGSIGIPIPGGTFNIDPETSELIYKGPNVMMGYAESANDLSGPDLLSGLLHTGDTAIVDSEGYYTITGRLKRFIKLFGLRINLDEVEKQLETRLLLPVACTGDDDRLIIVVERASKDVKTFVQSILEPLYKLHKSSYKVFILDSIPRMANGKINYNAIKGELK